MFLLFITLAIKVYVPFWNLLSHTRCVTHFSSAGALVKHCTLTTFQQLHLITKAWKKLCTYLNQCFSPSVVQIPQVNFFHRNSPAKERVKSFFPHSPIWAYSLPTFKLKVYLCPLWSWDKFNPCQTQACSNFSKRKKLSHLSEKDNNYLKNREFICSPTAFIFKELTHNMEQLFWNNQSGNNLSDNQIICILRISSNLFFFKGAIPIYLKGGLYSIEKNILCQLVALF